MAVLVSSLFFIQTAKGDFVPQTSVPYTAIDPGRIKERTLERPQNLTASMEILEQENRPSLKSHKNIAIAKFKLSEVIMSGVTIYKQRELLQYYKSYLGKNISLSDLHNIANAITAHYRRDGYMHSRAIVPAQQIRAGKARIQVVE